MIHDLPLGFGMWMNPSGMMVCEDSYKEKTNTFCATVAFRDFVSKLDEKK